MKAKKQLAAFILLSLVLIFVIAALLPIGGSRIQASALPRTKYYTTMTVQPGDTLWSIATRYRSREYASLQDYMDELCSMNHINDNRIYSGLDLVVAYYAD